MNEEPVKAEHINAFAIPLLETLDRMLGIKASAKGVSMRVGAGELGASAVGIQLAGRMNGEVFFVFGEKSGPQVASLMVKKQMGVDKTFETLDRNAASALKEFANVAMGHAVGKLKDLGVETTISTPVLYGDREALFAVMEGKSVVSIPFVMGYFGQVELALNLRLGRAQVEGAYAKRVMVVDDSSFQRDVLKMLLQSHGYAVVGEAEDGEAAVRLFRELRPDIVTLDIIMPGQDGIETLKCLKEIDAQAKVVMVSSISDKDRIMDCRRLGAEHYILKPYEPDKIIEVLRRCS